MVWDLRQDFLLLGSLAKTNWSLRFVSRPHTERVDPIFLLELLSRTQEHLVLEYVTVHRHLRYAQLGDFNYDGFVLRIQTSPPKVLRNNLGRNGSNFSS